MVARSQNGKPRVTSTTRKGGAKMRTSAPAFLIAGILALTASAKAGMIAMSFNELQIDEEVLNYYNGGCGSMGTCGGLNFGVSFDSAWRAELPDTYNRPGGKSALIDGPAIMNVPAGWSGDISFYSLGSLEVDFYDQQNGLGNMLLTWTVDTGGNFYPVHNYLSTPFYSAVFNASGAVHIDTLGTAEGLTPEPGTGQLSLLGIVGVFSLTALRRRLHSAGYRLGGKEGGRGSPAAKGQAWQTGRAPNYPIFRKEP